MILEDKLTIQRMLGIIDGVAAAVQPVGLGNLLCDAVETIDTIIDAWWREEHNSNDFTPQKDDFSKEGGQ